MKRYLILGLMALCGITGCVETSSNAAALTTPVSPFREALITDVASDVVPVLIKGETVPPGSGWDHVVRITTGSSGCTATVVGPQTIITAAHCAGNGATSVFKINGKEYRAKITRSSLYPGRDHDIALGKTDVEIPGTYATIGGTADKGKELHIFGYGCTQPGGGGGNDGILRRGKATIVSYSGFDAVSTSGSALCYGDSGGPAFLQGEKLSMATADVVWALITINSKGNIKDTNYTARLDIAESKAFLTKWATDNSTAICGVNATCSGGPGPGPGDQKFAGSNKAIKWDITVNEAWLKDTGNNLEFVKTAFGYFTKYVGGE